MRKAERRTIHRVTALVLSLMMLVGVLPMSVFADKRNPGVLSTDIGDKTFMVNEATEFTFTTIANDDVNTMVRGAFEFTDPEAIEKLEYFESKNGQWYEFHGEFGPETGFPMIDGTSKFRVTFNKVGKYTVTASMKTVAENKVLCSTVADVVVKGKPATLTTDIGDKIFMVNEATEFTFTTTANDDANTMVRGAFKFSDPEAIEKLEYLESKNGQWYELSGDFGPETGFPMIDGTNKFRATFKKAGNYTVEVMMKDVKDNKVLCSLESDVRVEHKVTARVSKNEGGIVYLDGKAVEYKTVDAGSLMQVSVKADAGYKILSLNVGGVLFANAKGQKEFAANISLSRDINIVATFVKVYTVTVDYQGNGNVKITDPETEGGSVTVETGSTVKIEATPEENYRVSEVVINKEKQKDVTGENGSGYSKTLTADNDYTVVVTFASNVYSVQTDAKDGTVLSKMQRVNHGEAAEIILKPNSGYTVDTVKVNGEEYEPTIIKGENHTIKFTVENITADQIIEVSYKAIEVSSKSDVQIDSSEALRVDGNLMVMKEGSKITFETDKDGIRVYDVKGDLVGGGETTKSVEVNEDMVVKRVELFYQGKNEYYPDWHEVLMDEIKIVVDDEKPIVSLEPTTKAKNGYYNSNVTFKVNAEDTGDYSGLQLVKYEITCGDISSGSQTLYSHDTETKNTYSSEDQLIVDASVYNSQNVKVTLHAVDRAGNEMISEADLQINSTKPSISVDIDGEKLENAEDGYYIGERELTITVKDRADTFLEDKVAAGLKIKKNGDDEYIEVEKQDISWEHNGGEHIGTYVFEEEGYYEWSISYENKAGLVNEDVQAPSDKYIYAFCIDKENPKDLDIWIDNDPDNDTDNETVRGDWNNLIFKFYDKEVTIKLSADCGISGEKSLKYQIVTNVTEYKVDGPWLGYDHKDGIVVSPNKKFVIYFKAEDRAGHVTIIRSTGIVVDNQKPIGETNKLKIDILPAEPNTNGIHNGDVNVNLKVVDPKYKDSTASEDGYYSGLKKITYRIYTTDTEAVEEGTLLDLESKEKVIEGAAKFDQDGLVSSWSGSIKINSNKFNSNNVFVEVTAIDNAGNPRTTGTEKGEIKIDITDPKIEVTYSNNEADSNYFFKADRTATIIVTERNLKEEDIHVDLVNADGVIPAISGWKKTEGEGNLDDTTYTATLVYDKDGDYEFGIWCKDLAERICDKESVNYGDSVAPIKFTIDKIKPTIAVTYDNNNAQNGNYYKAARKATIVITEHNFRADRVTITHTATDDGEATTRPTISGWTSRGDKHTATISYNKDAKYTFDITINDKAGNTSADYQEETFFVDTKKPTLEITGIGNHSSNNGDVIPVVSYSDTNYDAKNVKITLSGANRGPIELDGTYTDIHNGRKFTFKNFAKEQEIDDFYTLTAMLTDKAGHQTEKNITFSVNRFGSTYALSEATEKLNGTYVKEPIDVVITETNVDELSNIKITLFKDAETKVLNEDTDYKINVVGGNGQWYKYTYTIFAKNFDADGVYGLTVESDDKAENSAKNDQDTKDKAINFGVDSTLPIVNVENLESKTTYALDNKTVTMSIKDNLKLTKVFVELDGKEYRAWTAEELEEIIKNGGNFTFDIPGNSTDAHSLVVYAVDAAGNGEKISDKELPANAEKVEDFYVTTNLWVRYYTNKPLFFGSIVGMILAAGLIVFLVVSKKKKRGED